MIMREGLLLLKQLNLFFSSIAVNLLFLLFIFSPPVTAKGVNDFVIADFDATYTLTNEDPQGLLTVTEIIEVNFSGQNQGILRAIPSTYHDNDLELKVISADRDGQIEPFITYEENGNTVIRIGEAGVFISGEHQYTINYQVENVISFYDDFDEFYWDINGDQWLQPFEQVSLDLQAGTTGLSDPAPQCFTGGFGSTASDCSISTTSTGIEVVTTQQLNPQETLTVVQAYEKGYFTSPSFFERYREYFHGIPFIVAGLWLIVVAARRWSRDGKDIYKRGVVAPYFSRPKNVSLLQAGYVAHNKVTTQLLSAAIIDFAIRGVLKITEDTTGKKAKHKLELVSVDKDLTELEELLLTKLFGSFELGKVVSLEDEKNKLSSLVTTLTKKLDDATKAKGYYDIAPRKAFSHMTKPFVFALLLAVVGGVFASTTSGVSLIAGLVALFIVIVYGALMTRRSQDGEILSEHMEGLKLYLSKAEKDRIEIQDAVAAPLAKNASHPVRSVEFYEKLLPFAVLFGVEKSWTEAFGDLFTEPPEWFNSQDAFNAALLSNALSSTSKVASQAFTAPSSSGSSGSSGGFSGGGGGGGGGGGW
jgi:uncharacterized membrane protein YgcG